MPGLEARACTTSPVCHCPYGAGAALCRGRARLYAVTATMDSGQQSPISQFLITLFKRKQKGSRPQTAKGSPRPCSLCPCPGRRTAEAGVQPHVRSLFHTSDLQEFSESCLPPASSASSPPAPSTTFLLPTAEGSMGLLPHRCKKGRGSRGTNQLAHFGTTLIF